MRQDIPKSVDVLIVGAGPTGLVAANHIAFAGKSVLIVDRNPAPLNLPRAISIDDEGCRTIAAAGLADPLRAILRPGAGSRYVDEHGGIVGEVGPGPVEYGWPRRNNFHQPELERVLRAGLERFSHATLIDGAEMTGFEPVAGRRNSDGRGRACPGRCHDRGGGRAQPDAGCAWHRHAGGGLSPGLDRHGPTPGCGPGACL